MAKSKKKPNELSVEEFLNTIEDEKKRKDGFTLLNLMKKITGCDAQMWYGHQVGFGIGHSKYDRGSRGDMPLTAFSVSKQYLTLYIMDVDLGHYKELLNKLGKYKIGSGFLWINRLSDIHIPTLKALIEESVKLAREEYRE
jgi:hypothetical protein